MGLFVDREVSSEQLMLMDGDRIKKRNIGQKVTNALKGNGDMVSKMFPFFIPRWGKFECYSIVLKVVRSV